MLDLGSLSADGHSVGHQRAVIATFPIPKATGGSFVALKPQAGNTAVLGLGNGLVYHLKLHNAVHQELPPPSPPRAPRPGVVGIADDGDGTAELEWREFSGPLRVVLQRRGGCDGRVAVEYSTYGTNDDDPDFTPMVGPPPPLRTKWTRRVPYPVLIGPRAPRRELHHQGIRCGRAGAARR